MASSILQDETSNQDNDACLIRMVADFSGEGRFGQRTLEVTDTTVRVLEADGPASEPSPGVATEMN